MRIPLAAVLLATFAQATLAQSEPNDWTGYRNERFGFFLRYPANVLRPEKTSEAGDGEVFVSSAGDARLLVGVLPMLTQSAGAILSAANRTGAFQGDGPEVPRRIRIMLRGIRTPILRSPIGRSAAAGLCSPARATARLSTRR
jgi:hypothetical protein